MESVRRSRVVSLRNRTENRRNSEHLFGFAITCYVVEVCFFLHRVHFLVRHELALLTGYDKNINYNRFGSTQSKAIWKKKYESECYSYVRHRFVFKNSDTNRVIRQRNAISRKNSGHSF